MTAKQLCLVIILLMTGYQYIGFGADGSTTPADEKTVAAEPELSKQLKIYKNTLLEGKSQQIRIDAASEILISKDPTSHLVDLAKMRLKSLQEGTSTNLDIDK